MLAERERGRARGRMGIGPCRVVVYVRATRGPQSGSASCQQAVFRVSGALLMAGRGAAAAVAATAAIFKLTFAHVAHRNEMRPNNVHTLLVETKTKKKKTSCLHHRLLFYGCLADCGLA